MHRISLLLLLLVVFSIDATAAKRKNQPVDTVGVDCRGVLETFHKVGDGISERLDFYKSEGMTHYFYCPSDDKYCNRWGWKFLYNDSDRKDIRNLVSLCDESYGYRLFKKHIGLTPGEFIRTNIIIK